MLTSLGSAGAAARTGTRPCRSLLEIAIAPAAVRIARRWAAGRLALAQPPPQAETVDAVVLAVSELVTNAITATCPAGQAGQPAAPGRSQVWLVITSEEGTVRVEVHDSSAAPLPPVRCASGDEGAGRCDEGGRGLSVVAALATSWGWRPGPLGKVVWCELKY